MSSSTDTANTACANCGKAESIAINLKRCTACKMVKYCSRDCQVAHRSKHKKACKRRAAELFDEELFQDPPDGPECPICMLPLPLDPTSLVFQSCCGQTLCLGCVHAQIKEDVRNGKCKEEGACEFCRTPHAPTYKEELDRLNKGVERNNANSMEQLALYYLDGEMGFQKNLLKAMELFQKAGELGCANAYGRLGLIYWDSFECQGLEKDNNKAKHYWELGAIGGDIGLRHNLACLEERNGDEIRACKHFLICAKAGYEPSLDPLKIGFQNGVITKDEYSVALRAYQKQSEDRKSAMRDEAYEEMS